MDPTLWGPQLWFFLHTLTLQYPDKPTWTQQGEMNDFLVSVEYILPCANCKIHYKNYLLDNPPTLTNRGVFIIWMIDLHNMVNLRLNKQTYSYESVIQFYKDIYNKKQIYMPQEHPNIAINKYYKRGFIFLFIISLVLLFFVLLQRKPTIYRKY